MTAQVPFAVPFASAAASGSTKPWWSSSEQNAALWPALKLWFRCNDGQGALLKDYAKPSETSGLGSNCPGGGLTINNYASAWGTPGGFTSNYAGQVYARSTMTTSTQMDMLLGYRSVIIEVDVQGGYTAGSYNRFFHYGRGTGATTNAGIWLGCSGSSGTTDMRVTGGASSPVSLSFTTGGLYDPVTSANFTSARKHIMLVWDRTEGGAGAVGIFINGGLAYWQALASDPGAVDLTYNADRTQICIGCAPTNDSATGGAIDATFYEVRMWALSALPTDLAALAVTLAANPQRLPAALQGAA
jgi:hypothetical protein